MIPFEKGEHGRLNTRESILVPGFEHIEETFDGGRDLVCFCHLRWDFVYQRPQHLMSRFAREGRVFFVEEPVIETSGPAVLSMRVDESGVCVVVPHLPGSFAMGNSAVAVLRQLIYEMFADCAIRDAVLWYYTPMARAFTDRLRGGVVVYDCMDELSLFKSAPKELRKYEAELLREADVVFTGGVSLYEAKKSLHRNIHPVPSSIDTGHFKQARSISSEPSDQSSIPRPRVGFAGVIDERFDVELMSTMAEAHRDWHFVLVGPVVKIDPNILPKGPNIHYLGSKPYDELPAYMSGWNVAIMPFARNDATRYISPTKTPEYLAAGKPVVSTSIRDVVATYQPKNLVRIADTPEDFAAAIQQYLEESGDEAKFAQWQQRADSFLATTSWELTWTSMKQRIEEAIAARESGRHANAS
jgi:UDP-galactopyranose mutase